MGKKVIERFCAADVVTRLIAVRIGDGGVSSSNQVMDGLVVMKGRIGRNVWVCNEKREEVCHEYWNGKTMILQQGETTPWDVVHFHGLLVSSCLRMWNSPSSPFSCSSISPSPSLHPAYTLYAPMSEASTFSMEIDPSLELFQCPNHVRKQGIIIVQLGEHLFRQCCSLLSRFQLPLPRLHWSPGGLLWLLPVHLVG